ncbi:MAG: aconitate hydratase AcnA [Kiloniellales bacterium]
MSTGSNKIVSSGAPLPSWATIEAGGVATSFIDLPRILDAELDRFPWTMRILVENVVRHAAPGDAESAAKPFVDWLATGTSGAEIPFLPNRVLMHDTTCIPALVDIAGMRDAIVEKGGDPTVLNAVLPVDVSIDHSVAVDHYGLADAMQRNMEREVGRNAERYRMMKWATSALKGVKVHAPGTGIMHTINLEQLATVVTFDDRDEMSRAFPDTLIGTDSHTPMVNGIGVLAWGVGGLEAESVLFGMPVTIRIPDVVGVRLTGQLREGTLSTDLALAVTERLRQYGLSGEFVEFYGRGVATLTAGDRAVVANMAPEYGASTGYFPIDEQTLSYLRATGRDERLVARVGQVARRQGLWFRPESEPRYSDRLTIDLSEISTSLAGPRRPQDRIRPAAAARALEQAFARPLRPRRSGSIPDGAVAIAAITSCTNTSDPRLLIAAGLVARKARQLNLCPPAWVKTSLAPGSPAAKRYLDRVGLLEDLAAIGFDIVGYGCTTCIGNSGPLEASMSAAIAEGTVATAVLSGNRNFPGRVHPELDAGFLASPPLVVAYALAGDVDRDILTDPLAPGSDGRGVRLADLWPSSSEIDSLAQQTLDSSDFGAAFAQAEANAAWHDLTAPDGALFEWDPNSSYLRRPPFATDQETRLGRYSAHPILVLGDDITTDHISPAGQIGTGGDAAAYLTASGQRSDDFNVYAARRGNWEVMLRGLFTNRAVHNLLAPTAPAGSTIHALSGDILPLWQAARRYADQGASVVVVAGERFGTGSSRDWAAKGLSLLGVRAVLASSFERIHRSNLIGMGILPLRFPDGVAVDRLALVPGDRIEVEADSYKLKPRAPLTAAIRRRDGAVETIDCTAEIGTSFEVELLRAGGIIPTILRRACREAATRRPHRFAHQPSSG